MVNKKLVSKIACKVESEWEMGGLAGGKYEEFALEILERYLAHHSAKAIRLELLKLRGDKMKKNRALEIAREWYGDDGTLDAAEEIESLADLILEAVRESLNAKKSLAHRFFLRWAR